ncbi:MAG: SurA N-terminal domain-containing protein [Myxococcota bacterium]|nr:SurA N-terminal domain-containing protein [Myxococcota bacterium]
MLDIVRKNSGSILMYPVLGAIIFVFAVTFGPGGGSCDGAPENWAARVNGEIIRQQDFAVFYNQRLDQMRQTLGGGQGLDPELLERLGLRRQVIDGLIDRKLLAQEGARRGLAVSDEELVTYMTENFGLDNVTPQQFENYVTRTYRMPVWRFEEDVRNEILGQKVANILMDNLSVSEVEVKEQFFKERDRVMVAYAKFDLDTKSLEEPSADAVAKLIADEATAVEARYAQDKSLYQTPRQVRSRQILRKLARDATPEQIKEATAYLVALKQRIDAGEDFAELAKVESQDEATASEGGDMGTFTRGQMIKPLADAAFGLAAGAVTAEPVKTRLGVHLIKVEEVIEPKTSTLDEVREKVAVSILKDRSAELKASGEAQALIDALQAGQAIDDLTISEADARELDGDTRPIRRVTPWVRKSDTSIPRIGFSEEFLAALFELTEEKPVTAKPHKVGRAYFVADYVNREVPSEELFSEEKEQLVSQAVSAKRQRVLRDWLKHLRQQSKVDLNASLFNADGAS